MLHPNNLFFAKFYIIVFVLLLKKYIINGDTRSPRAVKPLSNFHVLINANNNCASLSIESVLRSLLSKHLQRKLGEEGRKKEGRGVASRGGQGRGGGVEGRRGRLSPHCRYIIIMNSAPDSGLNPLTHISLA